MGSSSERDKVLRTHPTTRAGARANTPFLLCHSFVRNSLITFDKFCPSTSRHYYELCTLWELRGALRAGDVWVASSRRYANPETYLIPKARWAMLRPEVCQQLQAPEDGAIRLARGGGELTEVLPRVERLLARRGQTGTLRMEKGRIVVPPLDAEERPERIRRLEDDVASRLPLIDLPELLIEVDQWTGFSHHLRHLNIREPRRPDFLPVLYAALLAQGCNFGFARMAQMADLS